MWDPGLALLLLAPKCVTTWQARHSHCCWVWYGHLAIKGGFGMVGMEGAATAAGNSFKHSWNRILISRLELLLLLGKVRVPAGRAPTSDLAVSQAAGPQGLPSHPLLVLYTSHTRTVPNTIMRVTGLQMEQMEDKCAMDHTTSPTTACLLASCAWCQPHSRVDSWCLFSKGAMWSLWQCCQGIPSTTARGHRVLPGCQTWLWPGSGRTKPGGLIQAKPQRIQSQRPVGASLQVWGALPHSSAPRNTWKRGMSPALQLGLTLLGLALTFALSGCQGGKGCWRSLWSSLLSLQHGIVK